MSIERPYKRECVGVNMVSVSREGKKQRHVGLILILLVYLHRSFQPMAPTKARVFDFAPEENEKKIIIDETDLTLTNCLRRHLSRISKEKASVHRDPSKSVAIVFLFKSGCETASE